MGKIFDMDFRKGSLIDSAGSQVLTNPDGGGGFERGDEGLVWRSNSTIDYLLMPTPITVSRNSGTIVVWAKANDDNKNQMFLGNGSNNYSYTMVTNGGTIFCESDTNGIFWTQSPAQSSIVSGKYIHIVIIADNGTVRTYLNGLLIDTRTPSDDVTISRIALESNEYLSGDSLRTIIYDHALTEKERAKLYQEFLRATPITKTVQ